MERKELIRELLTEFTEKELKQLVQFRRSNKKQKPTPNNRLIQFNSIF